MSCNSENTSRSVLWSTIQRGRLISKVSSGIKTDRRAKLRAAAVKVRKSMSPEFRQMKADDIMAFLRGDDLAMSGKHRGR